MFYSKEELERMDAALQRQRNGAAMETLTVYRKCEYPGCNEPAEIVCAMLGCDHYVCPTHGNCSVEETPDHIKGWGDA